jgi:hypothetical protein
LHPDTRVGSTMLRAGRISSPKPEAALQSLKARVAL